MDCRGVLLPISLRRVTFDVVSLNGTDGWLVELHFASFPAGLMRVSEAPSCRCNVLE